MRTYIDIYVSDEMHYFKISFLYKRILNFASSNIFHYCNQGNYINVFYSNAIIIMQLCVCRRADAEPGGRKGPSGGQVAGRGGGGRRPSRQHHPGGGQDSQKGDE